MSESSQFESVLAHYPPDFRPLRQTALGSAGGFSGAIFWQLDTRAGDLCLRRWPPRHPTPAALGFIHDVLRHCRHFGIQQIPVPLGTTTGSTFVTHAEHLWELTPWMPGRADYAARPSAARLRAAMTLLADFHNATQSHSAVPRQPTPSPGLAQRLQQLDDLAHEGGHAIRRHVAPRNWPELANRAAAVLELFFQLVAGTRGQLRRVAGNRVPLIPCVRDVWHDHLLFTGDQVTGLVDFGALRVESPAGDIARLLGSLAGDDPGSWRVGMEAYLGRRQLSELERALIPAFDTSSVLLSGMNWLQWMYVDGRIFEQQELIINRLDTLIARMRVLIERPHGVSQ